MPKLQCQNCGGMADVDRDLRGECPYCGALVRPVRVSSFRSITPVELEQVRQSAEAGGDSLALAVCFLKVKNFTLAKAKLEKVIGETPECCEAYYYYALAILNGRDYSSITMREARKIEEYLRTAQALDPDFVYARILYGLLCIGYYAANDLQSPADGYALLSELGDVELDETELDFLRGTISPNQRTEFREVLSALGLL